MLDNELNVLEAVDMTEEINAVMDIVEDEPAEIVVEATEGFIARHPYVIPGAIVVTVGTVVYVKNKDKVNGFVKEHIPHPIAKTKSKLASRKFMKAVAKGTASEQTIMANMVNTEEINTK